MIVAATGAVEWRGEGEAMERSSRRAAGHRGREVDGAGGDGGRAGGGSVRAVGWRGRARGRTSVAVRVPVGGGLDGVWASSSTSTAPISGGARAIMCGNQMYCSY